MEQDSGLFDSLENAGKTPQDHSDSDGKPLAEQMRPVRFSQFAGQDHLVGKDGALRPLLDKGFLHSMIFWGDPGVGKTTLARLLAGRVSADFVQLSAVTSGVGDVRKTIDRARLNKKQNRRTLLFIDEIHRFNKAQQDALLHAVEEGTIILVGATTENPSFEVISPLLSRCRVYKFKPLTDAELERLLERAVDKLNKDSEDLVNVNPDASSAMISLANGDARELYNLIERAFDHLRTKSQSVLTLPLLEKIASQSLSRYDKSGDKHYDTISAFIKSVRNSEPDAAVYWLARMIHAGEDPLFIARRLIILASEDIGNANPNALLLANAAFDAVHKIGMPEGRIVLSQVTTYLASSYKSNAAYKAINEALDLVNKGDQYQVPLHMRNAPTKLMKAQGYSDGYRYAHDEPGAIAPISGLPPELADHKFYRPTDFGAEAQITKRLEEFERMRQDAIEREKGNKGDNSK